MSVLPLEGVRVLSMEQAAALPFATRHLADLGAEVIRVQSHKRREGPIGGGDPMRNKRQLALDLADDAGPEIFRRLAKDCDVVAHNFTPRVVEKFGIDFESIRAINPDVVYLSITGFGTTGPWGPRPLFGPGAEAVSGHNLLIGEPDGWPGRPGTIVYADNVTGITSVFAVLAALEERDRTGKAQFLDVSLYESAVSHLGPVLAEAQLGAEPARTGNGDARFAIHGVFDCVGTDRHLALAVTAEELPALGQALGLNDVTEAAVRERLATMSAEEAEATLQQHGLATSIVRDAAEVLTDPHLWSRGYFGVLRGEGVPDHPYAGPAWGGGPLAALEEAHPVGTDSRAVLRDGGFSDDEIEAAIASGVVGVAEPTRRVVLGGAREDIRVERGELTRIDDDHDRWIQVARESGRLS